MAKAAREKIRLNSSAGTGHFYTTTKNKKLTPGKLEMNKYCRFCSTCEASCPHGVPVSEVLRTRMYATDYGDRDYASREYAGLAVDAAACASCQHAFCLGKCPQGLEIPRLTRSAHRLLGKSRA